MINEIDCVPDFFHSFTFDNGIIVEFNKESTINFYNTEEELIMRLDPSDLTTLYAAHRAMVREIMEEGVWSDHTIKDYPSPGNLGGKQ